MALSRHLVKRCHITHIKETRKDPEHMTAPSIQSLRLTFELHVMFCGAVPGRNNELHSKTKLAHPALATNVIIRSRKEERRAPCGRNAIKFSSYSQSINRKFHLS